MELRSSLAIYYRQEQYSYRKRIPLSQK